MKTQVLILLFLFFILSDIKAITRNTPTNIFYYNIKSGLLTTGSGHGKGYTLNFQINNGRKALEAGVIFNANNHKLSGCDIRYKIYLGSFYRVLSMNKIYKPYLQYNLVFQKGKSTGEEIVSLNGVEYIIQQDPGMIATIGQYLGYGNKITLFNNAYLDSSLGFGIYQGSLDKINEPNTFGYHKDNFGLTYSLKIGFGYIFKTRNSY